jgi:hypothetical protein
VAIAQVDGQVLLEWPPVAGAEHYEVWTAVNDPYFSPGADCAAAANCSVTMSTSYTPEHALGDPGDNYAYVVRAANACGGGAVSPASNATAEFDYDLVPGG